MSIKIINLGTEPDGLGGDTLRSSATKTNENFVYTDAKINTLSTKTVNDLSTVQTDLDNKIADLVAKNTLNIPKLNTVISESSLTKAGVASLDTKTDNTNIKVTALEAINVSNIPKLTSVISESATNKTGLVTVNTLVAANKTDITNIKTKNTEQDTAIAGINTSIGNVKSILDSLNGVVV